MLRLFTIVMSLLVMTACTRMPAEYREKTRSPVMVGALVNEKMTIVGSAVIGQPTPYLDKETGVSGEITVHSEYFSANGRLCRRYSEKQSTFATATSRLGCESDAGWVEIPVAAFAG